MFWSDAEREGLRGTDIEGKPVSKSHRSNLACEINPVERIGKDEAEKEYYEKLMPVLQVSQIVDASMLLQITRCTTATKAPERTGF